MPQRREKFHFGAKLFGCLIVAAVCGFAWALFESGRTPGDIISLFRGPEETPGAGASTDTPPPKPGASIKDAAPPKSVVPPPPKPSANEYTDANMQSLFVSVESLLKQGRIQEAHKKIEETNRLLVPSAHRGTFGALVSRVENSHALLQETNPGAAIPFPAMHELRTAEGVRAIIVKNLVEAGNEYSYETLTGIRSRLPKSQVRELTPINDRGRQAAAVDYELEKLCMYRNVTIEKGAAGCAFLAGAKVNGLAFFDLADFCARNGHNTRLAPLFDEARKRDPGIQQTVHEEKADRLVNVFFYFLSLHAKEDARLVYKILQARYANTRAYRDKVAGDGDVVDGYQVLVGEKIAAAVPPPPPKSGDPVPPPTQPDPPPTDPDPPRPPPTDPDPPPTYVDDDAPPDPSQKTTLASGAPDAAIKACSQGDAYFEQAMKHLRRSDPVANPSGWGSENKKALELFGKAWACYETAQRELEKAAMGIPQNLLRRARDTTMSRALCRKRAVSTR